MNEEKFSQQGNVGEPESGENTSAAPQENKASQPEEVKPSGGSSSKNKLGLNDNIEVGFCYLLRWLSGIILYFVEKENKKIQFHAAQSAIFFLGLFIISFIIGFIPVINMLSMLIRLFGFIAWIFLMIQGFTGKDYHIPVIAGFVEDKLVGRADDINS
ncbi:MAG: hypothetical protein U9R36_04775 [Elusimicrobiota bacterium]|nr:hypothetical protein [Elusimicrobiota bacterium]